MKKRILSFLILIIAIIVIILVMASCGSKNVSASSGMKAVIILGSKYDAGGNYMLENNDIPATVNLRSYSRLDSNTIRLVLSDGTKITTSINNVVIYE